MSATRNTLRYAKGSSTLPTARLLLLLQRKPDEEKDGTRCLSERPDLYYCPLWIGHDSCRRAVRIVVATQLPEVDGKRPSRARNIVDIYVFDQYVGYDDDDVLDATVRLFERRGTPRFRPLWTSQKPGSQRSRRSQLNSTSNSTAPASSVSLAHLSPVF